MAAENEAGKRLWVEGEQWVKVGALMVQGFGCDNKQNADKCA